MSSSDTEESIYIQEIKRFVDEEKTFPTTSDSESTDENPVEIASQLVSSDSADDYFNIKKRKKVQTYRRIQPLLSTSDEESEVIKGTPASSSSEHDDFSSNPSRCDVNLNVVTSTPKEPDWSSGSESEVQETDKRDFRVVSSGSSFVKIGFDYRKRIIKKKRRTNFSEEKRRVDQNIRRAKEKILNRTLSRQGEWRQVRTFGLPLEGRRQSTLKEDNLYPDHRNLEVQNDVCLAIGEPSHSGVQTSMHQVSELPQKMFPVSVTNSTQHVQNFKKSPNLTRDDKNVEFSVDFPTKLAVHNSDNSTTIENPSESSTSAQNVARSDDGSYSPPPRSPSSAAVWSSPNSFSTASPFSSCEGSTASGYRDTSSIPKSPWFKGKAPGEKKALPLEKALSVRCVRIEQSIQFSKFSSPFVQVNGEKYNIRLEQWHNILIV